MTHVLVRVTVVLLASPGRSLDVGESRDGRAPLGLESHAQEFRVLDHHRRDDTEERLVRREQSGASSQGVALHPRLESVFRELFKLVVKVSFFSGKIRRT